MFFSFLTQKIDFENRLLLKFIYSEKATKFCEIFPLLLFYVVSVKSKGKISQNFVAFSEYMNFTVMCRIVHCLLISGHKWQWVWLMPMNIDPKTVPTYYIHKVFMG